MPIVAETGRERAIIEFTDCPSYFNEVPKSRWRAMFHMVRPYCWYQGLSRPYFSRMFFSIAGGMIFSPE